MAWRLRRGPPACWIRWARPSSRLSGRLPGGRGRRNLPRPGAAGCFGRSFLDDRRVAGDVSVQCLFDECERPDALLLYFAGRSRAALRTAGPLRSRLHRPGGVSGGWYLLPSGAISRSGCSHADAPLLSTFRLCFEFVPTADPTRVRFFARRVYPCISVLLPLSGCLTFPGGLRFPCPLPVVTASRSASASLLYCHVPVLPMLLCSPPGLSCWSFLGAVAFLLPLRCGVLPPLLSCLFPLACKLTNNLVV